MSLPRRALLGAFGAGASAPDVALITARGREELVDELGELSAPTASSISTAWRGRRGERA